MGAKKMGFSVIGGDSAVHGSWWGTLPVEGAVMVCYYRACGNKKSSFFGPKVSKILNRAGFVIKLIGFNGAWVISL